MNLSCLRIGVAASAISIASFALADLNVTTSNDAMTLVNSALGAPVAGLHVTGASYSGAAEASGTYTGLTYGPFSGLSSGLLLTTGDAQIAKGPNDQEGASWSNGGPTATFTNYDGTNDIDLNDVATLSINFHADTAMNLSFDFTFGSEEYYYFVNSEFNDSYFAFLDGGSTLAVDPLGNAITINNQFLSIDNRPSDFDPSNGYGLPDKDGTGTQAGIDQLQYNGFTVALRTSFDVAAGDHTLTFVIGDATDTVYDSGVFISHLFGPGDGGGTDPVPEPGTMAFLALGSSAMILRGARHKLSAWRKR